MSCERQSAKIDKLTIVDTDNILSYELSVYLHLPYNALSEYQYFFTFLEYVTFMYMRRISLWYKQVNVRKAIRVVELYRKNAKCLYVRMYVYTSVVRGESDVNGVLA